MLTATQNPEQLARNKIDYERLRGGWLIQNKTSINLAAGVRVAVREYQTNFGPADYIIFVNKKPVGVIEAKREEEGLRTPFLELPALPLTGLRDCQIEEITNLEKSFKQFKPKALVQMCISLEGGIRKA
jgi:type I site-specific restriction endonuclease